MVRKGDGMSKPGSVLHAADEPAPYAFDRIDIAGYDDDSLMGKVDAMVFEHQRTNRALDLSAVLRVMPGIESRPLPFDIAIEAVLHGLLRYGAGFDEATATLIANYPDFKEQISRAAFISAVLSSHGALQESSIERETPAEVGPQLGSDGQLRYELIELCGRGASGRTFKAVDRLLSDRYGTSYVAIKILDVSEVASEDVYELLSEANRASAVSHDNVVRVRDRGTHPDGWAYIVMEYVAGGNMERWRPGSEAEFIEVASQIADGLQAIHSSGTIHSDLKPENILLAVDERGQVHPKLSDFGVSRVIEWMDIDHRQSVARGGYGNIAFQAPEIYSGGRRPNVQSDVYSLGGMLMYLATGTLPNPERVVQGTTQPDATGGLPVSRRLRSVLSRCLSEDPLLRPQSAGEVASQLRAIADRMPVVGIDSRTQRAVLWCRRHPVVASFVAAGMVAGPLTLAAASQAREGWAYERGKREVAASVYELNQKIRPSLEARDSVYDMLDSFMAREMIRSDDALSWLADEGRDIEARLARLQSLYEGTSGSLLDELLLREQLIMHQLQNRSWFDQTPSLIAEQRNAMSAAGLLSEQESDQLDLFEALCGAKLAVLGLSSGRPLDHKKLGANLQVLNAYIVERTTDGRLAGEHRRDPRVRLALRAAEWLSSKRMLDEPEVHRPLARIIRGINEADVAIVPGSMHLGR